MEIQGRGGSKCESAKTNIEKNRKKLEKFDLYGLRFLGHLLREWGALERLVKKRKSRETWKEGFHLRT